MKAISRNRDCHMSKTKLPKKNEVTMGSHIRRTVGGATTRERSQLDIISRKLGKQTWNLRFRERRNIILINAKDIRARFNSGLIFAPVLD